MALIRQLRKARHRPVLIFPVSLVIALMISLFGNVAGAGNNTYTNSGPVAGPVHMLAADPLSASTLYAASNQGLWKSTNAGASWSKLPFSSFYRWHEGWSVAAVVRNSKTVIYAGSNVGVLRSRDGGATWGATGRVVNLPPANPNFYYLRDAMGLAASGSTVYVGWGIGGVMVSTDDAHTFYLKNTGLPSSPSIKKIVLAPGSATTAYAIVSNRGLYRTTDQGANWVKINPPSYSSATPADIAVDPVSGTLFWIWSSSAQYSNDQGATWTAKTFGNYDNCDAIGVDTARSPRMVHVYCDQWVYKFNNPIDTDYYSTKTLNPNTGKVYQILGVGGSLYAATSFGVYKTPSQAIREFFQWVQMPAGMISTEVNAVSVDPTNANVAVAGAMYSEVFKTVDGGNSWAPSKTGIVSTLYPGGSPHTRGTYDLARDKTNPSVIYAGTQEDGVFRSSDGGSTWSPILENKTINAVMTGQDGSVWAANGANIYEGTGGTGWTLHTASVANSWGGTDSAWIYSMVMDPTNSSIIYGGTPNVGLVKTSNRGLTWSVVGLKDYDVWDVAIDKSTSPPTVWAATSGGPYKSIDRGLTWTLANPNLNDLGNGWVIEVYNSGSSAVVYYGNYSGLYASVDRGANWVSLSSGLFNNQPYSIGLSANGKKIYVGTYGGGVFTMDHAIPGTPLYPTVLATGSTKIQIGWRDNATHEFNYKVERKPGTCTTAGTWTPISTQKNYVTTYAAVGLAPNTYYSFRIRAWSLGGDSLYSACVAAKTGVARTPDSPVNLAATAVGASAITLGWGHTGTNETSFRVYRQKGTAAWSHYKTLGANVTVFTDGAASYNSTSTTYRYFVVACNAYGCSPATPVAVVPFVPTSFSALVLSRTEAKFTWIDRSTNESGFQVWGRAGNCSTGTSWNHISWQVPVIPVYERVGLEVKTTYAHKVRAFSRSAQQPYAVGNSLFSNCVAFTTP